MTPKPIARHNVAASKYPITLRLFSGKTGDLVWSRVVTLDEARQLATVEIPCYAGTDHYPVRAEIAYADGTTSIEGMA
jgi:hypothetical protein